LDADDLIVKEDLDEDRPGSLLPWLEKHGMQDVREKFGSRLKNMSVVTFLRRREEDMIHLTRGDHDAAARLCQVLQSL
jgi:hypothetical protein